MRLRGGSLRGGHGMSLTEDQKVYLNEYASTLRDSADKEYIAARSMFKLKLDDQFYWHAQQALEKYLKAILLYNEEKIKKQGHDLSKLYCKMVCCLDLEEDSEVMSYLEDMKFIGLNRYEVREKFSIDFSLLVLDKLVYFFRRFCDRIIDPRQKEYFKTISFEDEYKKQTISFGYLEKVLENEKDKYKEQRTSLVWKNFYFGEQKRKMIKNYNLKCSATNSLLLRHKEAYLILKDYIIISKTDKDFFEKHHGIKVES